MAGRDATSISLSTHMNYEHPSESGVPPGSRQRQRSHPHTGPLQSHPSIVTVVPSPQNPYRSPHQGPPVTLASTLMDPSTYPASTPPVMQRGRIVDRQRTLSNVPPRLQVVHSPPFASPGHIGSPIREENMHRLSYVSPSMMTVLPPHALVHHYRRPPDLGPTSSYIFPPSISAPTSPIYPTSPPHSPSIIPHSTYPPMGYTTSPSYPPPSPVFVPAPSIYGPHGSPPHYSRPYSFPAGQERQGTWWYSPPGSSVAFNSIDGTQRELRPRFTDGYFPVGQLDGESPEQPNAASLPSDRRQVNRTRIDRTLNDARQEAAQLGSSPPSPTSARARYQERRSYHPNPPTHRSEWVMWTGNIPSGVTEHELRVFFNQPLPPAEPGTPKDRHHQVYGGVLTVFLIARSNCAFVNFGSEAQLDAATARFHGQPIRPDDPRCPRLVCRVRKREDDLMAGVGAQRGSGMHTKWVEEQKARIQRDQTDTVALPKDMVRPSSSLLVSSDDNGGLELSRPASVASTNSDILTRYFPQRYFILKSLTQVLCPALLVP